MKVYEDAVLLPAHRPTSLVGRYLTRYGRYDSSGAPIKGWPIFTSVKSTLPWQPRHPTDPVAMELDRPMIYAGCIIGWFGHFIIESLPNLLAAAEAKRQNPDAAIIAHTWAAPDLDLAVWRARYAPHLEYFCTRLGLDSADLHLVLEPVRVRRLIVPEAPFPRKLLFKPWVLNRIDSIWPQPDTLEKVYFSRTQVKKARVVDEPAIETLFARNGFRIVHPQNHSIDEQIAIVRGAEVLAGPQGSALHWSLYAARCRAVVSLGYPSLVQRGICHSRGQRYMELRGWRPFGAKRRLRRVSEAAVQRALDRLG